MGRPLKRMKMAEQEKMRGIIVEERHLQHIYDKIGRHFEPIGLQIGLETKDFDNIEYSNPRASLSELSRRMLNLWREQTPSKSRTIGTLLDALRAAKKELLAEGLEAGIAEEIKGEEDCYVVEEPPDEENGANSQEQNKSSNRPVGCASIAQMKGDNLQFETIVIKVLKMKEQENAAKGKRGAKNFLGAHIIADESDWAVLRVFGDRQMASAVKKFIPNYKLRLEKVSMYEEGGYISFFHWSRVSVHHGKMNIPQEIVDSALNEDRQNHLPLSEIKMQKGRYYETEVHIVKVDEVEHKPVPKQNNRRSRASRGGLVRNPVKTFPVRTLEVKEKKDSVRTHRMSLTGINTEEGLAEGMKIRVKVTWCEKRKQFEAVASFRVQVLVQ